MRQFRNKGYQNAVVSLKKMYKDQQLAEKEKRKMNKYHEYLGSKKYEKEKNKRSQYIFMADNEKRVGMGLRPPRKLNQVN